jgi:hypothetical protein
MLAHAFTDEPIVLGSDDGPEDGDDDLDNTYPPIALDGEQPGHDVLDLDILHPPLSHSADKVEDGDSDDRDNDTGNNISPRGAKRQRSGSPCCELNLDHTSTPPRLHHKDGESSMANACGTGSDDLGGDGVLSKRRKLPDFLGSTTTLSSHNVKSSPSLTLALEESEKSEDDRTDVSTNLYVEDNLISTARTTPELPVSSSLRKPQMSPELGDTSQDWEVREVFGKEYVDGVLHYMVEWCPTLQPVHSLEHAKELVDEFEARLRALHKDKEGRVGHSIKRDMQVTIERDLSGGQQQKKRPRGRPRKQK